LVMHTTLTHSSGQWMSSTMPIICKTPDDIQKVGSSVTYCRRYMMCSILGISPIEDDDGQAGKENDTPQIALITPEGIKELNELFVKAGKDVWERTRASFVKQYPNFRSLQDLTYNDYVRVKCDLIVETQNSEAQNESV
jgi:hypothetical protein